MCHLHVTCIHQTQKYAWHQTTHVHVCKIQHMHENADLHDTMHHKHLYMHIICHLTTNSALYLQIYAHTVQI